MYDNAQTAREHESRLNTRLIRSNAMIAAVNIVGPASSQPESTTEEDYFSLLEDLANRIAQYAHTGEFPK